MWTMQIGAHHSRFLLRRSLIGEAHFYHCGSSWLGRRYVFWSLPYYDVDDDMQYVRFSLK